MSETKHGVGTTQVVESSSSWDGTPLPAYPEGVPRVTILRAAIQPGAKLEMHRHRMINAGMVLRGELTVVDEGGGAERTFRAGEGIVELVGRRHYGENRGGEVVDLVMFYAGAEGMSLSEK